MRALNVILFTGLCFAILSCKKVANVEATIVRDCTGTYLRFDSKDYRVCNHDKLASYPDGKKLVVSFKKVNQCNGSAADEIVCYMFHENEGWIEVLKVN
jgi:hypothetical protein